MSVKHKERLVEQFFSPSAVGTPAKYEHGRLRAEQGDRNASIRVLRGCLIRRNPLEGFRMREAQPPRTTRSSRPSQQPLRRVRKGTPGSV